MLIYLVTVFSAICGSSAREDRKEACYGSEVIFPKQFLPQLYRQLLYFTPRNGGKSKVLMEEGKAKDSRLKISSASVSLKDINKRDEGVYTVFHDGKDSRDVLKLKVIDCAEKINRNYMHNLEYVISEKVQYLEYNPPDREDVPLILWNRTNTLNNDKRRGNIQYNVWRIPGVTQADNGFYNFRRGDKSLDSRILLTVKENTGFYDPKVNKHLLITNPWTGRPWTVTFKQETEDEWVTVIKNGQVVQGDGTFSERITIQSNGIEIYPVETMDSGTFEFRDQQGNLALSVQVEVFHESHHMVTYIVAVMALLLGICCCCCCKKDSVKDKSAEAAAEGNAVTYHGTNQPTGPTYSNQPYPSVYPPQQVNPPDFTGPAAVSIEPPPIQPNTAVYPPQPTSMYPPEPTNGDSPQPTSLYPPAPTNGNVSHSTSSPPEPTNGNSPQPTSLYPPAPTNGNLPHSTSSPPEPTNGNSPQPTSLYPPAPTNGNVPHSTSSPPEPTNGNSSQPTSLYPPAPTNGNVPHSTSSPPEPTNGNLPQPESSQYPRLSQVGPPTSQGSAAAPTFNSDVFSSDAELEFELKGMTFPSASFLSSDETSSNVYNSDKLNFL